MTWLCRECGKDCRFDIWSHIVSQESCQLTRKQIQAFVKFESPFPEITLEETAALRERFARKVRG